MNRLVAVAVLVCLATALPPPADAQHAGGARLLARQSPGIHPAVVRIIAPGRGSISYGSGTLVATNEHHGLVLTNWHVVNEATEPVTVMFPDGFHSTGRVQKIDRVWDLAAVVIWRPNVEPVSLAGQPPRPGEMLTIAGYGSGVYRAVSGRCTQYVAPGVRHPYEMVELAASARQGDSGGPIFNSRGELAGVLFGEGGGRTSGSYCGRVNLFLADILPAEERNRAASIASAPSRPPLIADEPAPVQLARQPSKPLQSSAPAERPVITTVRPPVSKNRVDLSPPSGSAAATSHWQPGTRSQDPQTHYIGWQELAGATRAEQVKTVLAAIGSLAVVALLLRLIVR